MFPMKEIRLGPSVLANLASHCRGEADYYEGEGEKALQEQFEKAAIELDEADDSGQTQFILYIIT